MNDKHWYMFYIAVAIPSIWFAYQGETIGWLLCILVASGFSFNLGLDVAITMAQKAHQRESENE